jgi:DNA-binding response OmpR family regulator
MRLLIVEDEFWVAREMAAVLVDAGHTVVGIAGTADKAIQCLAERACDAAIIDANLKGDCADQVGAVLRDRGIPFVVTTGYAQQQLRGVLRDAAFLKKPVAAADLLAWLATLEPARG